VEGFCEHGNEPSDSIKCWEVLERLQNWGLLRKGSAPCVSKTPTQLGPLELSRCLLPPSPEDVNRFSFRKVVTLLY
jgi:hypothetical protein